MPPAAVAAGVDAGAIAGGGATRSGRNVQSAYMVKAGTSGGDGTVKPANWNTTAPGKRQRTSENRSAEEGAAGVATPGPNTPATTGEDGAAIVGGEGGAGGVGGMDAGVKKQRGAWSAEAVALGYEAGTIKNSAYVLLAASGLKGMTVAAIVEAATKQG
jgi:hypothetical protein